MTKNWFAVGEMINFIFVNVFGKSARSMLNNQLIMAKIYDLSLGRVSMN